MKKAKGAEYAPRDKPKKRPGKHKKSKSKLYYCSHSGM